MLGATQLKHLVTTTTQLETAQFLRRLVLALALLGIAGTLTELLLIKHYDGFTQLIPFMLLGLTALGYGVILTSVTRFSVRAFRILMVVVILGSAVGVYQHYLGNLGFQLEVHPDLSGWSLIWKTVRGGVPLLAPGILLQVGLLGLGYSYRLLEPLKDSV